MFENVVGLLSAAPDGYPIVDRIRKEFMDAGYKVADNFKDTLFEVCDYGIPQHRKRVIIIGIRMDYFDKGKTVTDDMIHDFYKVIMPSFRTKQRTVNEAIGDLPKIFPLPDPVVIMVKNILTLLYLLIKSRIIYHDSIVPEIFLFSYVGRRHRNWEK